LSQITKIALANSLKKFLSKKSLDKITIVDLVEDCGVNRQTFYYHFRNIYDLIEWIYTTETSRALGGKKTYQTWEQGFLQIFEYVLENKFFVLRTYNSISREHLENYLYDVTYDLLMGVVEEKAKNFSGDFKDKKFIADFYKYAFVGVMLEWIREGMKDKPDYIVDRIYGIIQGDIEKALSNFENK